MRKLKRAYICDYCSAMVLEETYFFVNDVCKDAPCRKVTDFNCKGGKENG